MSFSTSFFSFRLPTASQKKCGAISDIQGLATFLWAPMLTPMLRLILTLMLTPFTCTTPAQAELTFQGESGIEGFYFFEPGQFDQDQYAFSFRFAPTVTWHPGAGDEADDPLNLSGGPRSTVVFSPYLRWDSMDDERSHVDIREGYWQKSFDYSELTIGIAQEFWGKMEFANVVDVINQRDFIDDPSGRAKLGQPMVRWTQLFDQSEVKLYLLYGHRDIRFPSESGRLRPPIVIDSSLAEVEGDEGSERFDVAGRWSFALDDAGRFGELALSYFQGVSRTPDYALGWDDGEVKGVPIYPEVEQWGLEWEWLYEGWAVKVEAVEVKDARLGHWAAAAGVEYTWGDLFGSGQDLTAIVEYLHDERGALAPTFTEHDWVFGFRWVANNINDSELLVGIVADAHYDEQLVSMELSSRWGERAEWKIALQKAITEPLPEPIPISSLDQFLEEISNLDLTEAQADQIAAQAGDLVEEMLLEEGVLGVFTTLTGDQLFDSLSQFAGFAASGWDQKLSIYERDAYVRLEWNFFW